MSESAWCPKQPGSLLPSSMQWLHLLHLVCHIAAAHCEYAMAAENQLLTQALRNVRQSPWPSQRLFRCLHYLVGGAGEGPFCRLSRAATKPLPLLDMLQKQQQQQSRCLLGLASEHRASSSNGFSPQEQPKLQATRWHHLAEFCSAWDAFSTLNALPRVLLRRCLCPAQRVQQTVQHMHTWP